MRELRALALAYEARQDRILAVANPGALDSWSYWLTRRLVLEVLGRLPAALEQSSPIAKEAPAEYRGELAAFERETALAKTQPAMTQTPDTVLQTNAAAAELAVALSLTDQGAAVRLDLHGERGSQVTGIFTRADLQRVLHMLEHEVTKAGWCVPPVAPAPSQADLAVRKRQAN
jgi:hypothetical protein